MKIALGIISIIVCTFIGYKLASKYSERRKFYNSFISFNKKLQYEVSFTKVSLVKILEDLDEDNDVFVSELKNKFLRKEENSTAYKFLSEDENKFFKSYMQNIGSGDSKSQTVYLEGVNKVLEANSNSASEDEKKYKSLYIKLGFLIGLVILIILL